MPGKKLIGYVFIAYMCFLLGLVVVATHCDFTNYSASEQASFSSPEKKTSSLI